MAALFRKRSNRFDSALELEDPGETSEAALSSSLGVDVRDQKGGDKAGRLALKKRLADRLEDEHAARLTNRKRTAGFGVG